MSPDIPVVVPGQTYSIPPSSFPVQIEPPSTSNYHNFSNPLVSISVTEALRSHSPVVVQPTVQQPNFHLWNGTVNEQRPDSPVNPPTMATGAYSPLLESTPVVNPSPAPNLPLHHPSQSSQGITMNSPSMNPQLNTPRLKGMLVDGQPAPAPPPVHMTRSKNALGQPPPLVVHLKDRGGYELCVTIKGNKRSLDMGLFKGMSPRSMGGSKPLTGRLSWLGIRRPTI